MEQQTFKIGDRVTPKRAAGAPPATLGRVFVVKKVNPRNLRCDAVDGGRGINFPASMLMPATGENLAARTIGVPYAPVESFSAGEVVTLKRAYREYAVDTPMVVLKQNEKRVNVAPLGGDGDRYLRVPPTGLTRREMPWLTMRLGRMQFAARHPGPGEAR